MKFNYIYLCLLCCLMSIGAVHSQTAIDALRYSELFPSGTARMVGVGGAMGSLGGDFGALSANPAGLGVYRKSEFVITPSLQSTSITSVLNGDESTQERQSHFGLENLALVFYKEYDKPKLKSINFAAGVNRLVNFNRVVEYGGSTPGSIVNSFQENAQGLFFDDLDPFTSQIASDAGAIFTLDGVDDEWFSDFDTFEDLPIDRTETITTTGGLSEILFALGANISDKLYLGASVNAPIVRFEEVRAYTENDQADDVVPFFRDLTFGQTITTTGIGIGFKVGAIYRITNEVRLGASIHSPTRYSLSDNFTSNTSYFFIDESVANMPLIDGSADSPAGSFDYLLKTPWRYSGGASVVLRKFGFISLDIEYLDYTNLEYDFNAQNNNSANLIAEQQANSDISEGFDSAFNVKIGLEFLIKKIRLRAGYGIYGAPFDNEDSGTNVFSLGAGIKGDRTYLDLAFRATKSTEGYTPYTSSSGFDQQVISDIDRINGLLTFGYRF